MKHQKEFTEHVISFFNTLIEKDPTLAKALFAYEWPASKWVRSHKDIKYDGKRNVVRLIGLLNGLVGEKDGQAQIKANYANAVYGEIVNLELNGPTKSS